MSEKETPSIVKSVDFERVPKELIDKCLNLSNGVSIETTFYLAWTLDKFGLPGMIPSTTLFPITQGKTIAGTAVTVRNLPDRVAPYEGWRTRERSMMGEGKAYPFVKPGDVLVIDSGGRSGISGLGGHSASNAKNAGMVGAIVDGGIIHVGTMRKIGFPVWTRGLTPVAGVQRVDTVEINVPVSCAGVQVRPGDLVAADDSGVVVVPGERVREIVDFASKSADLSAQSARATTRSERAALSLEYYRMGNVVTGKPKK